MRLWPKRETKTAQFETVLQRLVAAQSGMTGYVTPETCMKAPTVQALVTAISRRISITPVHVYQTSESNGKEIKEKLPKHPVANLLRKPNDWQSTVDYWQDLASSLVRHGKFIAVKGQVKIAFPGDFERCHVARVITPFGMLYFNHVGAHVRQQHGAKRPRNKARQIEHSNPA